MALLGVAVLSLGAAPPSNGLPAFWSSFRSAVLAHDEARIMALTLFPLEVHGVTDDDVHKVGRADFAKVWAAVLKEEADPVTQPIPELALIQRTPRWTGDPRDKEARLANIGFSRTPAGWRLVRVYLDQ